MQIHELDTFIGTTSDSTYLAIDDGTETNKIPATDLGITTEMTQAEAEAGTETAPRVISPAVLNSFVAGQITNTIIIENYSCGSNTVNSSGAIAKDIDVSASIPDGYKLVGVIRIVGEVLTDGVGLCCEVVGHWVGVATNRAVC